ncbi:hypothetical protein [Mycoplasma sp. 1012]
METYKKSKYWKKYLKISKKDGCFTTKRWEELGFTRSFLNLLIKHNIIKKYSKGVYYDVNFYEYNLYNDYYLFYLANPKIIYTHYSSAYLNSMTNDCNYYHYAILKNYKVDKSNLKSKKEQAFIYSKRYINIGKILYINNFGHKFYIYDRERTLINLYLSKNIMDYELYLECWNYYTYESDEPINLERLMYYAKLFNIEIEIEYELKLFPDYRFYE